MNRVQFQPGLSMSEFLRQFGTEEQCETAFERLRWPQGFRCQHCGETRHYVLRVGARKVFQCGACRKQTSLIAGNQTPLRISIAVGGDRVSMASIAR